MRGSLLAACAAIMLSGACGDAGDDVLPNQGERLATLTVDQLVETCAAWQGLTDTDWYRAAARLECYAEARADAPATCEQEAQACVQANENPRPKPGPDRAALEELAGRIAQSVGCAREISVDDIDACFHELVDGYAELSGTATCADAAFPVAPACDALFACDEFDDGGMWTLLVDDAQCLWLPTAGDLE